MVTRQCRIQILYNPTNKLSTLFRNFHSFQHGLHLLDEIPSSNISLVNHSILTFFHENLPWEALRLLRKQISVGPTYFINEVTIATALKACRGDPFLGSQIHAFSISSGYNSYLTVSNSLMSFYSKSGQFDLAFGLFKSLENPDKVSWNTILSGFSKIEDGVSFAHRMHCKGVEFDAVTYTSVLALCADRLELLTLGSELHSLIVKSGFECDTFVGNALITMYSRWGRMDAAERVFDEMSEKDLVSWNAMLSGYTQEGNYGLEAIWIFGGLMKEGIKLDHVSFTSVIAACGQERSLNFGTQVHGLILRTGYGTHVSVCNVLISMYSKCGVVENVYKVFESMVERNVISWTTMISIDEENALPLFNKMRLDRVYPNEVTFVGLIHAIALKYSMKEGEMIHGFCTKTGFMSELLVCNSLITMYTKLKCMDQSKKVFDELNYREIIAWNALISGYAQNGLCENALQTFLLATVESQPNQFTFGSVLNAIGTAEAISLTHGQRCHSQIMKLGLNSDPVVSGALLDMYAKRGNIVESQKVFDEMRQRSLVAWTTIISAYARHGDYELVMNLLDEMKRDGIQPDSITFLAVLAACGRKGMVNTGLKIFNSMIKDHKIEPSQEHYSSMVDILGRAGRLKEAEEFMNQMPIKPGLSALQSLLGACKMYGNVEMGARVADTLMEIESMESGSYVLMANMYAEKGDWEKAAMVWRRMRDRGVKKEIGFSWVDAGGTADGSMSMYGFSSGDRSHPRAEEIHRMVDCLESEMRFSLENEKDNSSYKP